MRLNLGCGKDVREGYLNVDLFPPCDVVVDLSVLPWPWNDGSADEIMMLDFLEHFPWSKTDNILEECWRVLKPGGHLVVQVPDFQECAKALLMLPGFMCNFCGFEFSEQKLFLGNFFLCDKCGRVWDDISSAAVARIFGGQDRPGNWHFTTFTKDTLLIHLKRNGFGEARFLERNENDETYAQNWNMKVIVRKSEDVWGDD